MFIQEIINSVVQIVLFGIIPFIWWICSARKKEGFLKWIGLKRIENIKKVIIPFVVTIIAFIIWGFTTLYLIRDTETATSSFKNLGMAGFPTVIVYALFHTSLPEEVLFRGFY